MDHSSTYLPIATTNAMEAVDNLEDQLDNSSSMEGNIPSDEIKATIEYVVNIWINSFVSYGGLLSNIVGIIVFIKMGFQDTMNISLTAIAFWDILKCLSGVIDRIYAVIELFSPNVAYVLYPYTTMYISYVLANTGYVSGALAAYVSVERCLCVSLPFTVKFLLTRKVVIVINVLLSLIVSSSQSLVFAIREIRWVYHPQYNRTVPRFSSSRLHYQQPWINVYNKLCYLLLPILSFIIIGTCTLIMVYQLRKASQIRAKTTKASGKEENGHRLSPRDRQVVKMLLTVLTVYIVCYIPRISIYMYLTIVPQGINTRHGNLLWSLGYFMQFADYINAGVNPIILFLMSTQFRATFMALFLPWVKGKK